MISLLLQPPAPEHKFSIYGMNNLKRKNGLAFLIIYVIIIK